MPRAVLLLCINLCGFLCFAQEYRYINTIFPSSTKTADVVYGNVDFINFPYLNENSTSSGDLIMDIYTPTGDTHNKRPAIIFAHSGGFINGNRNHDDMVALCDSFARKGYVTATIDYRKGFYVVTNIGMHSTRAAYRGLQDGRSAVRFLRANASTYGIDENKIYMVGSSAGSFIALHSVYMDDPAEKPQEAGAYNYSNIIFPFGTTAPDLGAYDIGDHLNENGSPDAIIGLWGAVQEVGLITADNDAPVFLVHGSQDGTVPFNEGNPFGYPLIPEVEGSNLINDQLDVLGLTEKETYFINGVGHEFYGTSNGNWANGSGPNSFWDIIVDRSEQFLWKRHKPIANFSFSTNNLDVQFVDNSMGAISWLWDFGDGTTSTVQNPVHSYSGSDSYDVRLYVENDNLSWDTIGAKINVQELLPVVWTTPLQAEQLGEVVLLTWSVAIQINNEGFVVESSTDGQLFEPIGWVAGDGFLEQEKIFSFVHRTPANGMNYYRIQQLDYDGRMDYSNIASLEMSISNFTIYPNPSNGQVSIQHNFSVGTTLEIYNTLGQLMNQVVLEEQEAILDLSDLQSGMYILRIANSESFQRLMLR